MEEYLYNSYLSYYNVLKNLGYIQSGQSEALLTMSFIDTLLKEDERGIDSDTLNTINSAICCLQCGSCILKKNSSLLNNIN